MIERLHCSTKIHKNSLLSLVNASITIQFNSLFLPSAILQDYPPLPLNK